MRAVLGALFSLLFRVNFERHYSVTVERYEIRNPIERSRIVDRKSVV